MKLSITNNSKTIPYRLRFDFKDNLNDLNTEEVTNPGYVSLGTTHSFCLNAETESFTDFDYAVIRYYWTSSGGQDLDTRTSITQPLRNVVVGWDKNTTDGTYLQWGSDNTGSGVEAVLLNLKDLIAQYPLETLFNINCNAFWYNSVGTGDIRVEFTTYSGGTMSKSGYDFINTGGTLLQTVSFNCKTMQGQNFKDQGAPLGYLSYNVATKLGQFINTGGA